MHTAEGGTGAPSCSGAGTGTILPGQPLGEGDMVSEFGVKTELKGLDWRQKSRICLEGPTSARALGSSQLQMHR